jgi:hypothetical protein
MRTGALPDHASSAGRLRGGRLPDVGNAIDQLIAMFSGPREIVGVGVVLVVVPKLPLPRRSHELERKRVQALVNFVQAKE